jgi:hypothetical protein
MQDPAGELWHISHQMPQGRKAFRILTLRLDLAFDP